MNRLMSKLMAMHTPEMNPNIMKGIVTVHMEKIEESLDGLVRGMNNSFETNGIRYDALTRCTPEEDFLETTKLRNNKRTFDLADTDIYMVKMKMSWRDHMTGEWKPLPDRPVYLPYVRDGGLLNLSGPLYHLYPILRDAVVSPDESSFFVRVLQSKTKFHRLYHTLLVNGVRNTTQITWSPIYRNPPSKREAPKVTKAHTSIVHYLLGKYGFKAMFERYAGFVPLISNGSFTSETHPPEKWVLCESNYKGTGLKPPSFIGSFYAATQIQLAIPVEQWTQKMAALVEGFFYVVDHFPNEVKVDYLEQRDLWMVLLGQILFGGYGYNKLYSEIKEHYGSLDNTLDQIYLEKLRAEGFDVQNFYDLMASIATGWNDLTLKYTNSNMSMYGKSLEVLPDVLYPITKSIVDTNYKINKAAQKRPLGEKDYIDLFNRNFRVRGIFDLASQSVVCESVTYSGDHLYPKITSKLATQDRNGGKKARTVIGPEHHLDFSQIMCGSAWFLSKSDPSPMTKANPFAHIDMNRGVFVPNPKFAELGEETQRKFEKR